MNTCRCGRDNDARRCYCGGCGRRIGKPCARCHFINAGDDAFCGGCGDALAAAVVSAAPSPPPVPTRLAHVAKPPASADTMSAKELAAILGTSSRPAPASLPAIVSQDDLDRLFGGAS